LHIFGEGKLWKSFCEGFSKKRVKCNEIVNKEERARSTQGFTLIELVTIIAIIGILATVLTIIINPATQIQKAHDAQRKSDLKQVQQALELYYQDNGQYPANDSSGHIVDPNQATTYPPNGSIPWGQSWKPYMAQLPSDPSPNHHYFYALGSNGSDNQTYYLYTSLERGFNDPQAIIEHQVSTCSCVTGCSSQCNYGVSSSNASP